MTRKPDRPGKSGPKRKVLRAVCGDPLKMPRGLTEEARREWRRVARHAATLGLRGMDQALLATYCESWATWLAARGVLAERGMTYEGPNHAFCKRPEVDIARRAEAHMVRVADALGFSPAARTRIQVDDPGESEQEREELAFLFGENKRAREQVGEDAETEDDPSGDENDPPENSEGKEKEVTTAP